MAYYWNRLEAFLVGIIIGLMLVHLPSVRLIRIDSPASVSSAILPDSREHVRGFTVQSTTGIKVDIMDPTNPGRHGGILINNDKVRVKQQERAAPYDLVLVFPFRNRDAHKHMIIPYLANYTNVRFPGKRVLFLVAEQKDELDFSRSWTFNAAYNYLSSIYKLQADLCVVIHDIDRFPVGNAPTVPYLNCKKPTQLSSENKQWNNTIPYERYAGGVLGASVAHWELINGMSNFYRGWGCEDDDLFERFRQKKLVGRFINHPSKGYGRFDAYPKGVNHQQGSRDASVEKRNRQHLKQVRSGQLEWEKDGFSSCGWKINGNLMVNNFTYPNAHVIQVPLAQPGY